MPTKKQFDNAKLKKMIEEVALLFLYKLYLI